MKRSKKIVQEVERQQALLKDKPLKLWFLDEGRFGLKTWLGKILTTVGVKPIGKSQHRFENYYLYCLANPATGVSLFMETPCCNSDFFEAFIKELAESQPDSNHLIALDNAGFHKAKKLKIPPNILLYFQPPYCPELNPVERIWEFLKGSLAGKLPSTLSELKKMAEKEIKDLTKKRIQSLTQYPYIKNTIALLQN